ncbi:MarR family transcriptional regulator [Solihabitans fulvus]|uniref:MarR family transcriptional regulator n=1 Tax=Solihabitans fulvus TaxID=1892852 RepID=A0A5B2X780_9PSEU|nr:MarR family transcriptional regulator [Solihabitans fulvus]KAA2258899.1 MarR family transcriptional regulator [Solihabitans fulvus]
MTGVVEGRDEESVRRFVERFGLLLSDYGMPRMPARVFAALLCAEDARHTAGELASTLQVSPAAISGAVRYLDQAGMVARVREPGTRRDQYELFNDLWYEMFGHRDKMLEQIADTMRGGAEAVGMHTAAGARLDETRRFFDFFRRELPLLMERWREENASSA